MTNEQAIANLKHAKRWNDIPSGDAIDIAIDALMKIHNNESLYYTIQDIMCIFGISKNTAYKLARLDGVPCMRIGDKYLFEKEAFNNWRKRNLNRTIII